MRLWAARIIEYQCCYGHVVLFPTCLDGDRFKNVRLNKTIDKINDIINWGSLEACVEIGLCDGRSMYTSIKVEHTPNGRSPEKIDFHRFV